MKTKNLHNAISKNIVMFLLELAIILLMLNAVTKTYYFKFSLVELGKYNWAHLVIIFPLILFLVIKLYCIQKNSQSLYMNNIAGFLFKLKKDSLIKINNYTTSIYYLNVPSVLLINAKV